MEKLFMVYMKRFLKKINFNANSYLETKYKKNEVLIMNGYMTIMTSSIIFVDSDKDFLSYKKVMMRNPTC